MTDFQRALGSWDKIHKLFWRISILRVKVPTALSQLLVALEATGGLEAVIASTRVTEDQSRNMMMHSTACCNHFWLQICQYWKLYLVLYDQTS